MIEPGHSLERLDTLSKPQPHCAEHISSEEAINVAKINIITASEDGAVVFERGLCLAVLVLKTESTALQNRVTVGHVELAE